jgi:hypothetical protein
VFESYAIYHAYCGIGSAGTCKQNNYEVVIPNYFDLDDFEFSSEKDDYFLFLGRVYEGKGVHIAIQLTEMMGVKLVIAGPQCEKKAMEFPPHVEYVGYASVEQRKKLMSRARATLIFSRYLEPFGGVQVESLLSGTPTITSDWGAFTENNVNGLTGYRCRTFGDCVRAVRDIHLISPHECRRFAEERFSLAAVAPMYEKYFQDVTNVMKLPTGWYTLDDDPILTYKDRGTISVPHDYDLLEHSPKTQRVSGRKRSSIPRQMHVVWLGDADPPAKVLENVQGWGRLMGAGFTVRLWVRGDINCENFSDAVLGEVLAAVDGTVGRSEKASILGMAILREVGGIYLDSSCIPGNSLEPLLDSFPNATLLTWAEAEPSVSSSFIGAIPGHPALVGVFEELQSSGGGDRSPEVANGLWNRQVDAYLDRGAPGVFARDCVRLPNRCLSVNADSVKKYPACFGTMGTSRTG